MAILYCLIMYGVIDTAVKNREYEKAMEYMGMFPFYSELFPGEYNSVQNEVTKIENQRRDKRLKDSISLPFGIKPNMTRSEAHNKMIQAGFVYNFTSDDGYFYEPIKLSGWYKTSFSTMYKTSNYMDVSLFFSEESIGSQVTLNTVYKSIKSKLTESYGEPSETNSDSDEWRSSNSHYYVYLNRSYDYVCVTYGYRY